jgi:hypothetical protein
MKVRLALLLAGALCVPVIPAHATFAGATCRGTAPLQPTCTTAFITSSTGVQVSHFRLVGRLTIQITSSTGSWKITCAEVPSPFVPECTDEISGGFLKGQVVNIKATSGGVGEYRVEVFTQ